SVLPLVVGSLQTWSTNGSDGSRAVVHWNVPPTQVHRPNTVRSSSVHASWMAPEEEDPQRLPRNGTTDQLQTVSLLCDQLWTALIGGNFHSSPMVTQWIALKKMDYDVAFRTLRHRIYSRKTSVPVLSSALTVLKKIVNPCNVQLSKPTERILANGPKFCVNIKPSRMDIVSAIHTVSSAVPDPAGKTALVSSSLKRMSDLVDDSYKSDHRNFSKIVSVKKELEKKRLYS
ncbi:unnamed protein product, partial [Ixodes hexagonus]